MMIEIIRVPAGPAPEWVRREWVGIKMEANHIPVETPLGETIEADFTTNEPIGNRGGYIVETEIALIALGSKSSEAVNWFRENIPLGMPWLSFGPDEVIIVP